MVGHTRKGVLDLLGGLPIDLVVHTGDVAGSVAGAWATRKRIGTMVRPAARRWLLSSPEALALAEHEIACLTNPRPDVVLATTGSFADRIVTRAQIFRIPFLIPEVLIFP